MNYAIRCVAGVGDRWAIVDHFIRCHRKSLAVREEGVYCSEHTHTHTIFNTVIII